MANKSEWKVGDRCPNDGGELHAVPAPSDAERAASRDRDNPVPLRPGVDTATEQQIGELGTLYRCASCGYQSRAKGEAGAGDRSGAASAGQANTRGDAGAGQARGQAGQAPAGSPAAAPPPPEDKDAEIARLRQQLADQGRAGAAQR